MTIAHMDRTPIGARVVLLDPLTLAPLPVQMADPRALEPNPDHPPLLRDARYLQELDEVRDSGRLRIPLTALTDGFLVDGHRRHAIALEIGLAAVPVCYLNAAQARALVSTYTRAERRAIARYAHGRCMLERMARLA